MLISSNAFKTVLALTLSSIVSYGAVAQTSTPEPDEPSGPSATAPIQSLLGKSEDLLAKRRYPQALDAAKSAMGAALAAGDKVGIARADELEARSFEGLGAQPDAEQSWREAASSWKNAGFEPGQVKCLAYSALFMPRSEIALAKERAGQAISLAKRDSKNAAVAFRCLRVAAQRAFGFGRPDIAQIFADSATSLTGSLEPNSLDYATCLNISATLFFESNKSTEAEPLFELALGIEEKRHDPLGQEASLNGMGRLAEQRENYSAAKGFFERALKFAVAAGRKNKEAGDEIDLGDVARATRDLDQARSLYEDARATNAEPETIAVSENNEGLIDEQTGHLERARQEYEIARAKWKIVNPRGFDIAVAETNLANIEFDYGDLKQSKEDFEDAIGIINALNPNSPDLAVPYSQLANLLMDLNDLSGATSYYQLALSIDERANPRSGYVAGDLASLGHVFEERAASSDNESYYGKAIGYLNEGEDIVDKSPNLGNMRALFLGYFGDLDRLRKNYAKSLDEYKSAAQIAKASARDPLETITYVANTAAIEVQMGNFAGAEEGFDEALKVAGKYTDSMNYARLLSDIGSMRLLQSRPQEALKLLSHALSVIEKQRLAIANPNGRTALSDANYDIVDLLVGTYVALGRPEDAYNAMETVRGSDLTESISDNENIDFRKQVPQLLVRRQLEIDNERAAAIGEHLELDPVTQPAKYAQNAASLEQIGVSLRQLEDDVAAADPHLANLAYPKPMSLSQVQATLDPGTLLIEYSIGEQGSYIFTVTKTGFKCYSLRADYELLRTTAGKFFDSVSSDRAPADPEDSIKLYNLLLAPAREDVASAQRLLICPERFLWKVPFCALIDNGKPGAGAHYLIQSKPIHFVVSMNVYSELMGYRSRAYSKSHELVAFGDPAYRPAVQFGNRSPNAQALGENEKLHWTFTRSPITGFQVREIKALFGSGGIAYEQWLATRSMVFASAPSARYIHFACHATPDIGNDPLSSFIALSPEKRGEAFGILAAYDIIQNLRLHADLVTMAACASGTGQVTSSEGVLGLARAFFYAGADSVLDTLWEVDAYSSSLLMSGTDPGNPSLAPTKQRIAQCFYGALLSGRSKDQALQTAQISLIRGPIEEYRDPRHWAAFELQGDWK